uniref:phenylalanine tRNA synthetase n=1 Tax=Haslea pseudostrearia TaxID=197756 RepID=UPI00220B2EB4|nr:phenylalanine tRNA synthetase [Haslea pseudostrearia]UXN44655.1 phenylalanine tRNA synthetase [Haslea pseudostrearia]
MQISLKWINELVDIQTIKLNNLVEKLTLGGFEIEEILEIEINNEKEIVLDVSATANRSDSLSIQGISKEIAALLNKPINSFNYLVENSNWKKDIENQSASFSNQYYCSTFLAMTVENITNTSVPNWLKQKLISSGYTPTNNLLDFQTYLLLETGYPFEFYDLDKICSKLKTSKFNLTIDQENNNVEFFANNNSNYQLDNSISVVKANELAISIAGIISNKEFSYTNNTKALLIEGSTFYSTEIRQKSRSLSLRTNRSARYEKSVKNTYLLESFYKLLSLLRISNPELVIKFHTFKSTIQEERAPISLDYNNIIEVLGPVKNSSESKANFISTDQVTQYLNRLGFNYNYDKSNLVWKVNIPFIRSEDITREIDLIEEIGRVHGFNKFLTRLPKIKRIGNDDYSYKIRKKIVSCLLKLGFNELIHYSLVNEITFIPNKIKLINPLIEDYSCLRTTLLPSLLKTIMDNLRQGNRLIEGFEFGHIFLGEDFKDLEEKEVLAGIFGGVDNRLIWSGKPNPINWFEAKGKVEQFFKQLNFVPNWKSYSVEKINPMLHPYRTAELYSLNNNYLGIFGQINPMLAKKLNIPFNLYLFEFDFKLIQNQIQTNKLASYKEYFLYPRVVKDLSFIINQDINFEEVQSLLYLNGTKFLAEIKLLDEYRGSSIPNNHKSLCLQLTFQSSEQTLENRKIEEIVSHLQFLLKNKFGVQIRN